MVNKRRSIRPIRYAGEPYQAYYHSNDPVTGEPEYTDEQREWLMAIEKWKRDNFYVMPTCIDILIIARKLGYRKV